MDFYRRNLQQSTSNNVRHFKNSMAWTRREREREREKKSRKLKLALSYGLFKNSVLDFFFFFSLAVSRQTAGKLRGGYYYLSRKLSLFLDFVD